jgi:hypothetical protein
MEHFIIKSDEEASNILGLGQMSVKLGVQMLEDRLTDSRS